MSDLTNIVVQNLSKKEIISLLHTFQARDVLEKFSIDALRSVLRKIRDKQTSDKLAQDSETLKHLETAKDSEANSSYESLGDASHTDSKSDAITGSRPDDNQQADGASNDNNASEQRVNNMPHDSSERWEFNKEKDKWEDYVERLEFVFIAQNITDDSKKVAHLLTRCGPDSYKLIRDICAPTKLKDMKYDELVKKVNDHLCPKRSDNVERSLFRKTLQRTGESVTDFVTRLKENSLHCNFGAELNKNLCEQLSAGLQDQETKIALYSETDLTYEKAIAIAVTREAACESAASTNHSAPNQPIHHMQRKPGSSSSGGYRRNNSFANKNKSSTDKNVIHDVDVSADCDKCVSDAVQLPLRGGRGNSECASGKDRQITSNEPLRRSLRLANKL
ncbi:hypothetical protein QAD02_007524 [Eretmocerus hayati]|uniref:Uncharacterized protein n=1 Tax=Eretmocerus hayati TaxID=131215 RepID=A0ACC2N6B6_9HYME|nr:hypothetical protein QAD02_007524 [Eretmocerus hayati]